MNNWWTAEALYPRVTDAIQTAETLEAANAESTATKQAYRLVSILEEFIAALKTITQQEVGIARRAAIAAAIKAGDTERAAMLSRIFKTTQK